MYDGDELVLGTWRDIWEQIKKVLLDHRRKQRKCKVKYTKDLKNPVTSGNIKPVKVSAIKKHARTDDRDTSIEA